VSQDRGILWDSGDAYERWIGRWSRRVAPLFLDWLAVPPQAEWVDVGCGTGVLSSAILARCGPDRVAGVDPSDAFIEAARAQIQDSRFTCRKGGAEALPYERAEFTASVSGLVLNFVPDKRTAVAEMARVVGPGGTVALYVWDYAGQMQIVRYFFDAAAELDPGAKAFDDGIQASICRPGPLAAVFRAAGLSNIAVEALDIPTAFENFDDYWNPFLAGTGSAPKYCTSLSPDAQNRLRERIRERLPTGPDGEILLAARAWAVRGTVADG